MRGRAAPCVSDKLTGLWKGEERRVVANVYMVNDEGEIPEGEM